MTDRTSNPMSRVTAVGITRHDGAELQSPALAVIVHVPDMESAKAVRDYISRLVTSPRETTAEYCPIHPDVQIVVRPSTSVNGGSIGWGCAVCNCLEVERLRGFVSDEERSASVDRARNRRAVKSNGDVP